MQIADYSRFWAKVDATGDCWEWTATKRGGYGLFKIGGKHGRHHSAHRIAWELLVGPIPNGLELDHLCRNPNCVNPDHLEPVTHAENCRRGLVGAYNRLKTHCPQGHAYDPENTSQRRGRRICRTCERERHRRRRAAHVEA